MKNLFRKRTPTPQEVFIRTYLDSIAPGVAVSLSLIHI